MTYSYAELKGKIKVGDSVRAVKGKENGCNELNSDGSNVQKITYVDEDCFDINGCFHDYNRKAFLELLPSEITWETLKKGDRMKDGDGEDERTVLARLEDIVFLSFIDDSDGYGSAYTISELQRRCYTIVQPPKEEEISEMTVKDVEKLVGHKVKIVKE